MTWSKDIRDTPPHLFLFYSRCLSSPRSHLRLMPQLRSTVVGRTEQQGLPAWLPALPMQLPPVPVGACLASVPVQTAVQRGINTQSDSHQLVGNRGQWIRTSSFGRSGGHFWDTHQKVFKKGWTPLLKVVDRTMTPSCPLFLLPEFTLSVPHSCSPRPFPKSMAWTNTSPYFRICCWKGTRPRQSL